MKHKCYQKPTSKIIELQHNTMLLQANSVSGSNSITPWGNGGTTEDEIYM